MQLRKLSTRALGRGAGVSDSVIRNLLQHGIHPDAKDPDPKTLRAVADFLGIDALTLFRLAGYVSDTTTPSHSPTAEVWATLFDDLPPLKQEVVLRVMQSLIENEADQQRLRQLQHDIA
jgi:transcriptional regulator with XRE-family HTH domain